MMGEVFAKKLWDGINAGWEKCYECFKDFVMRERIVVNITETTNQLLQYVMQVFRERGNKDAQKIRVRLEKLRVADPFSKSGVLPVVLQDSRDKGRRRGIVELGDIECKRLQDNFKIRQRNAFLV